MGSMRRLMILNENRLRLKNFKSNLLENQIVVESHYCPSFFEHGIIQNLNNNNVQFQLKCKRKQDLPILHAARKTVPLILAHASSRVFDLSPLIPGPPSPYGEQVQAVSVHGMRRLPVAHIENSSQRPVGSAGLHILARFSAAVTYLDLNASQKQMFRRRSMEMRDQMCPHARIWYVIYDYKRED